MRCLRLLVAALPLVACSYHIYSLPARTLVYDGAATAGKGNTVVRGDLGYTGEVFDPPAFSGQVELRHGVSDRLDVTASAALVHVDKPNDATVSPDIYLGHVGVKLRPDAESGLIAIAAGAGVAHSPDAGTALSADATLIVAYENCVAVPFATLGAFASTPLTANQVYLGANDDGDGRTATAQTTVGLSSTLGFKVPLAPESCRAHRPTPALVAGGGLIDMTDGSDHQALFTGTLGFEAAF